MTESANAKERRVPQWEGSLGTRELRYPWKDVQPLPDKQTVGVAEKRPTLRDR